MNVNIGINTLSDFDSDFIRTMLMILIPLSIVNLILVLTSIFSIVKKRVSTSDKVLWICIASLISMIGPILYFAIGSNMLDQKSNNDFYDDEEDDI